MATNQRGVIAGRVDPANWKAAPHVLVTMYNEERERLVKWAKACRDAGVEESRVRLAERQGEMLATVLRTLLASLQAALVAAGLSKEVVILVIREQGPGLVRQSLSVAVGE